MKDEQILKPLREAGLIKDTTTQSPEDLTCEEECQGKLAVAIAACSLLTNPLAQIACMSAARDAYGDCSDKCDD